MFGLKSQSLSKWNKPFYHFSIMPREMKFMFRIWQQVSKKNYSSSGSHHRALARKLKLLTFSKNWEIRLVFTKDRHHGWQQENLFWYNPQNARKYHPGKEIFQSMTLYNKQKLALRNAIGINIWDKSLRYGIEISRKIDFGQIKVVNNIN